MYIHIMRERYIYIYTCILYTVYIAFKVEVTTYGTWWM
jgi:hypothetical protein